MVWRFLKHYGMGKATEVLEEFASAVVTFDPETSSKAETAMMQAELNKLGARLIEAEAEVRRKHDETGELQRNYDRYLEAASVLEQKLSVADDADKCVEIEGSLVRLIDQLERLRPEIERELQEDQEVETWAGELRRAFEELAAKLKNAERDLQSARRRMDTAKLQKQRAEERDHRPAAGAGLTTALSTISVALGAMNKETSRVRAESEALELKANVLHGDRLEHDPHIAAALRAARPRQLSDQRSLSDRLARLQDWCQQQPATLA